MANFAAAFKAQIARIARKEARSETEALKRTVSSQRTDIAALKRHVQDLERALKSLSKSAGRRTPPTKVDAAANEEAEGLRFRASGLASNRKRLGLSADQFGQLVGATGQSVYAWEAGKAKPRSKALAAIASLRGIGKREALARLEALKSSS